MAGRIVGMMMAAPVMAALVAIAPAAAQERTIDPNEAGTIAATRSAAPAPFESAPPQSTPDTPTADAPPQPADAAPRRAEPPAAGAAERDARAPSANGGAYQENDVLAAAEGVFGKGAEGLGRLIEKIFKDQGRPNAYIAGREVGGAVVVGVRYGSGTLFHKVEGQRPVYWTGPSVGFDLGANGAKTFVLAYNLYDTQDLFRRFPAAEGNVYVVGGFTASYLRWKDMVVIPIRLGVGWRLGANVGYMRFSEKSRWSPF